MTSIALNETMPSTLHSTPATQRVVAEQFRAVGLALRTEAYFFIGALLLFGILLVGSAVRVVQNNPSFHSPGFTFGASETVPILLLALFIPFGVWRTEDPSRRSYHWAMPVARGPHTIIKLLSGWAWLMIASIVYFIFIVVLAAALSWASGSPNHVASGPAWEWALIFTAPTLGYLLLSVAAIGSDHAWRWTTGVVLGFWILIVIFAEFGIPDAAQWLSSLWDGSYGLRTALSGATADSAGPGGMVMRGSASLSNWLVAMPIWIIVSAIAVAMVSYRHRE